MLASWREFLRGKKKRQDVAEFSFYFTDNILALHQELAAKTYRHGGYEAFKINDPKPRDIHKASVRDRLVHHAIYRVLYPYFDRKFIFDSYSCRLEKGTHRAVNRLHYFAQKVSRNNTRTIWILKCDIRKFFANINHDLLKNILARYVADENVLWLLLQVIDSFNTKGTSGVGLPLGNLTSQLLINIYLNDFDQFVKRRLKAKYYVRYCDDFVIVSANKNHLNELILNISTFLETRLKISLNPNKVFLRTFASGIDFLGWVIFPHHRVLRTATKLRMIRRLKQNHSEKSIMSYLGLLSHGNTYKISRKLEHYRKIN